ncbi:ribonuclease III [Cytophagaceae bacterium ABcell3]|nr:ribonuclease III [Cytophagaceae bacterium ABcell3]
MALLKRLLYYLRPEKDRRLISTLRHITGMYPGNLEVYKLAIKHTSASQEEESGRKLSNERLEYLGDAILGAVIAEFLFKKYPFKNEGFLTEIRSRIVNRESLNNLCRKIGLAHIIEYSARKGINSHKSMYGDALEALVGAVYLDKGFESSRTFILQKLLNPHFDLDELIENNTNFKSMLIEWAQKYNRNIKFVISKEVGSYHHREFTAEVILDEEVISNGIGLSKKKAEQAAAEKACKKLAIVEA